MRFNDNHPMPEEYAVIDLFAGPGGLAEGFSAVTQGTHRPFKVALSVEKERSAWETLRLRTFLRQFDEFPSEYTEWLCSDKPQPSWEELYPGEWAQSGAEALQLELGSPGVEDDLEPLLERISNDFDERTIVIGGPPCQAYSLVGRARNRGIPGYDPLNDKRHFLYEEYIRILVELRPAAFVMENVRGMLSSRVGGKRVFEQVARDLERPAPGLGYKLLSLNPTGCLLDTPAFDDYLVRAEQFGIPQARHRIIVVGVREDIYRGFRPPNSRLDPKLHPSANVRDAIGEMPILRSNLSREVDSLEAWQSAVLEALKSLRCMRLPTGDQEVFEQQLRIVQERMEDVDFGNGNKGTSSGSCEIRTDLDLQHWLKGRASGALPNNIVRSHMRSDLRRYLFVSTFGEAFGRTPKANDFPEELAPAHRNWSTGAFKDRFRVQLWDGPSTTVTSHIAKDGHAFIHPDPVQCRSLTVREAARLQTFPDDYLFLGNRTQQFTQVGNAVPPFLARQIGEAVYDLLEPAGPTNRTN